MRRAVGVVVVGLLSGCIIAGQSFYPSLPVRGCRDTGSEGVSNADVIASVHSKMDEWAECVRENYEGDRGLYLMSWSVRPDGSVTDVGVASADYARSPLAHCLARRLATLRFPESERGRAQICFPMRF